MLARTANIPSVNRQAHVTRKRGGVWCLLLSLHVSHVLVLAHPKDRSLSGLGHVLLVECMARWYGCNHARVCFAVCMRHHISPVVFSMYMALAHACALAEQPETLLCAFAQTSHVIVSKALSALVLCASSCSLWRASVCAPWYICLASTVVFPRMRSQSPRFFAL